MEPDQADALKIPVRVVAENEMTVPGAALYGFCGWVISVAGSSERRRSVRLSDLQPTPA